MLWRFSHCGSTRKRGKLARLVHRLWSRGPHTCSKNELTRGRWGSTTACESIILANIVIRWCYWETSVRNMEGIRVVTFSSLLELQIQKGPSAFAPLPNREGRAHAVGGRRHSSPAFLRLHMILTLANFHIRPFLFDFF